MFQFLYSGYRSYIHILADITADYLLGATEGYAPLFQTYLFTGLRTEALALLEQQGGALRTAYNYVIAA